MLCPKRSLQPDMQICGMWERLEPKGVTVSYSIHWGSLVPSNWKVPARHEKEWNSYQETSRGSRLHPTPFFGLPDADKPRRNFIKNLASWPKLVQIVPLICSKRFIHVYTIFNFHKSSFWNSSKFICGRSSSVPRRDRSPRVFWRIILRMHTGCLFTAWPTSGEIVRESKVEQCELPFKRFESLDHFSSRWHGLG